MLIRKPKNRLINYLKIELQNKFQLLKMILIYWVHTHKRANLKLTKNEPSTLMRAVFKEYIQMEINENSLDSSSKTVSRLWLRNTIRILISKNKSIKELSIDSYHMMTRWMHIRLRKASTILSPWKRWR